VRRSLPSAYVTSDSAPRFFRGALLPAPRARLLTAAVVVIVAAAVLAGCAGTWPVGGRPVPSPETSDEGEPVLSPYDGPGEGFVADDVPFIRVGLSHGVRNAALSCEGPYTVALFADSVETWSAGSGSKWRFGSAGGGITGSGPGGGFHMDEGTIRIRPSAGALLVFDGVRYRGEVELFASGQGSLTVVNVLDMESYLRGVVPKEIGTRPPEEIEAVKAQAVAARTYAMASGGKRASGGFDVYATVEDQVYAGVDGEDPVCDRAILETAGLYMTRGGEPIHAYFHANCGGSTEGRHEVWELPEVPYLKAVVDSPGEDKFNDAYCSGGSHFTWTETWDGNELARLVRDNLPRTASTPVRAPLGDLKDIRVTARTPSGRVRWLEIELTGGTYRVFGDKLRWLLRRPGSGRILRSAWIELDVERRGGRVAGLTAKGRGNGHGVGMCQHGAMEMARRGHGFADILSHYYKGVGIERGYGETP